MSNNNSINNQNTVLPFKVERKGTALTSGNIVRALYIFKGTCHDFMKGP